jgi:site-specific DNA recombinase
VSHGTPRPPFKLEGKVMPDKKIKAIALCRVSTKGQLDDGNLEPQFERINLAAEILNAEVIRWWQLAVSSRKGKNVKRKDLREMHDFCKRYKSVKYLIVDEVDRFMRSITEYYWWKQEFKNIGVQLRHANKPDIDPEDDRAVFDELIDIYRAEQSNNERINKTPDKMMAKIRAGYYPSNPKTGYKTTDIPSLHEPDEPNWSAMQRAFKGMAAGLLTVEQGLKQATEEGLATRNYGPKAVGGKPIDMYRWKELMRDPYFCGVIKMADWPEINDNGLHTKMITKEEHHILVRLADNKGKAFTPRRDNKDFPMSNEAECFACYSKNIKNPRIVGYLHNNGKKEHLRRYYKRYRCRQCNKNILLEDLHSQIDQALDSLILNEEQTQKLRQHFKKVWSSYEKERFERLRIAEGHLHNLKATKSELILSLSRKPNLANDIEEEIENLKRQIGEAEAATANASDFERDLVEFTDFALNYISNWKSQWWLLKKEDLRRCKQLLFPAGIQIMEDKKVYTPEISLVYRYEGSKKAPEDADSVVVEGPVGFEPTTRGLKGRCSNLLSYGPVATLHEGNLMFPSSRGAPK